MNPSDSPRTVGSQRGEVLRYRDFRLLCLATVFDAMGFLGDNLILGWVVLDLTDSTLMVGMILGARHAPAFFLGLFAGAIADTRDRRTIMRLLSIGNAAMTASLAALLMSGDIQMWILLPIAVVGGALGTMNQTARQAFAWDIVGQRNVLSGLSFVGLSMRFGGMIGALSIGFVLGRVGPSAAYSMLTGGYLVSLVVLTMIRSRGQAAPKGGQPVWESVKEFGSEMRRNRALAVMVIVVGLVEVLGFSTQVLMPSLARDTLNVGAEGLGIMGAFNSGGGLIAIALISPLGELRRQGLAFLAVIHVFGLSLVLLGLASTFYLALGAILLLSGSMALSDLFSQALMQRLVPNELRGRAMGAWVVAVGTSPLGNLQIGALASVIGVGLTLVSQGAALIVLGATALVVSSRLRKL